MSLATLAQRLSASRGRIAATITMAAILALGLGEAPPALAADPEVSATLKPPRISLDGVAQLNLTVHGAQSDQPALPHVEGLTFTPSSQSSSYELIDGTTTASESQTYQVSAARPGTYTIPAIRFQGGSTPPLVLDVLPGRTAATSAASSPGASLPPPTIGGTTTPSGTTSGNQSTDQAAFVRLLVPKKEIFVGQMVPIQIKAYFRSDVGVNLDGLPTLSDDAFTISNLTNNPTQSQESIHGITYTVVSWYSAVVPIKSGNYTLGLELPATLQIQQSTAAAQLPDLEALLDKGAFGDFPFDDSALQSLLGRVIEKPILLKAAAPAIDVLPLPTAGRPADFSGAVGSFEIQSTATPDKVAVGDPLTLTLNIHGEGNFDRVNSTGLRTDSDWKTYRPQASFSPQDSVGLQGSKKFEQSVVPLTAGTERLPAVEFSYFDPRLRQYVVRRTQPIVVSVEPGQSGAGNVTASTQTPPRTSNPKAPQSSQTASMRLVTGRFVPTLRPVFLQSWFATLPGIPFAVMASGFFFLRRRERLASDPRRVGDAAQSRVTALLAAMDQAQRAGDAGAFMTAARSALQVRLGQWWSMKPAAVTLAEIDARLDSSWDPVRDVFRVADQFAYSGLQPEVNALEHWQPIIHDQLQRVGQS
jgi:hypothetical protein